MDRTTFAQALIRFISPLTKHALVACCSVPALVLLLSTQLARGFHEREISGAPELVHLDGDLSPVHDPVIIKEKNTWYLFCTGGTIRRSSDLHHWALAGKVFDKLPDWATREIPGTRGGFWAPDISFHNGVYRLYYAVSTFGKNDSAIGLATNTTLDQDSPDYKWIDEGLVFRSHKEDDFNAIDPNLVVDRKGNEWLDFGSFWGGIKMVKIDAKTGKPRPADHKMYSLASRRQRDSVLSSNGAAPPKNSIEAPFIVERGKFFYLFVSFDYCCKGANSTYNVVVGRSREITGPYRDRAGLLMTEGGGTRLTTGTSLWRGPGHEGVLLQAGGPDLMVFHAYDANSGKPFLKVSTLTWNDGWPQVAALPGDALQTGRP